MLLLDDVFAALDPATAAEVAAAVLPCGGRPPASTRTVIYTTTRAELATWADHVVAVGTDGIRVRATDTDTDDVSGIAAPSTPVAAPARCHVPPPTAAADLRIALPRSHDLLRHAVGLYGRGSCAAVAASAALTVAASVAAAQVADTAAPGDSLVPLAALTTVAVLSGIVVFGLGGIRAVDRMTALQRRVLTALLRPGSAPAPLGRLTSDVHLVEFRASERLLSSAAPHSQRSSSPPPSSPHPRCCGVSCRRWSGSGSSRVWRAACAPAGRPSRSPPASPCSASPRRRWRSRPRSSTRPRAPRCDAGSASSPRRVSGPGGAPSTSGRGCSRSSS